jgi:hypothetical protein
MDEEGPEGRLDHILRVDTPHQAMTDAATGQPKQFLTIPIEEDLGSSITACLIRRHQFPIILWCGSTHDEDFLWSPG